MEYTEVIFDSLNADQKEILIALLSNIGFSGFEEIENSLKAYINNEDFNESEFNNIIAINYINYSKSIIKENNWNEIWENSFEPVMINYPNSNMKFVNLRANFHRANLDSKYDLIITPKMSFGTGHHSTTHLMIEQMSRLDFKGKTVIDYGTGTGILAILAEKLGANKIIAIDNDDWSISNSLENIKTNNCSKIELFKEDKIHSDKKADVILANINLNTILANISTIKKACKSGAEILLSGLMIIDETKILNALLANDIHIKETLYRNDWIAIFANG